MAVAAPLALNTPWALWDALVIEMGDLLAEVVVLHEQWATLSGTEGMIGVAESSTLCGGEVFTLLSVGIRTDVHGAAGRGVGLRGGLIGLAWQWWNRSGWLVELRCCR